MIAVVTVLIAVAFSLLITRIAAVALTATGMNHQAARFQARSAFTGVGYTTNESEGVVHHPIRRRIVMMLMLLGNAGIITIAGTLVLSFTRSDTSGQTPARIAVLLFGLLIIVVAANSKTVDRHLVRLIARLLGRWTDLEERDYARLLQLSGEYGISELEVRPDDWVADSTLAELDLRSEGIVVLGIYRADGSYEGVPKGSSVVSPGDTLLLYGRAPLLAGLDHRSSGGTGDQEHEEEVAHQQRVLEEQEKRGRLS